jgi:chromosome segregation ATPase
MDIGAIAGITGAIIAVGTLLGTSLRVGSQTATINRYREAAQSWEARAGGLEAEQTDLLRKYDHLQHSYDQLHEQNQQQAAELTVLRDLVTGAHALTELKGDIEHLIQGLVTKDQFSAWQVEARQIMSGAQGRAP